jgi:predicted  nucleic acid-binding Zn-ribbon protein
MKSITALIEDLSSLQDIDTRKRRFEKKSPQFQEMQLLSETIRERLPTAILKHYDLRLSKAKPGAAKVRNGICGACHLSLPSGQLADLRREDVALQVCGYCSVFLLPEDALPEDDSVDESKPISKGTRKAKATAAS